MDWFPEGRGGLSSLPGSGEGLAANGRVHRAHWGASSQPGERRCGGWRPGRILGHRGASQTLVRDGYPVGDGQRRVRLGGAVLDGSESNLSIDVAPRDGIRVPPAFRDEPRIGQWAERTVSSYVSKDGTNLDIDSRGYVQCYLCLASKAPEMAGLSRTTGEGSGGPLGTWLPSGWSARSKPAAGDLARTPLPATGRVDRSPAREGDVRN
jgi:hypothetical protein